MTEVSFYHLERQSLDEALPRLLRRVRERELKAVVLAENTDRIQYLNEKLWTFDPGSFLPHGTKEDGFAEDQPIYLTAIEENPASAEVLVVVDGLLPESVASFQRCLDLFNGRDPEALDAARQRWRHYKEAGFSVTYWRQNESGRWEQQG